MPSTGFLTCTLESSALIDAGATVTVLGIEAYIASVTSPKVRVLGTTFPKRVQFGGSYGLIYPSTHQPVNPTDVWIWSTSLRFESEYHNTSDPVLQAYRVGWKLPLGITVMLNVYF